MLLLNAPAFSPWIRYDEKKAPRFFIDTTLVCLPIIMSDYCACIKISLASSLYFGIDHETRLMSNQHERTFFFLFLMSHEHSLHWFLFEGFQSTDKTEPIRSSICLHSLHYKPYTPHLENFVLL